MAAGGRLNERVIESFIQTIHSNNESFIYTRCCETRCGSAVNDFRSLNRTKTLNIASYIFNCVSKTLKTQTGKKKRFKKHFEAPSLASQWIGPPCISPTHTHTNTPHRQWAGREREKFSICGSPVRAV